MTPVIAEMLLNQMSESGTDMTYYRGQRIFRTYLRRILWRTHSYKDNREAMRNAGRVLPMGDQYGK